MLEPDESVFEGPVSAVGGFVGFVSGAYRNPTAWWDVGGAWYVVTHPEADSTYVGATDEVAGTSLSATTLETAIVEADAFVMGSNIDTEYRAG
jgi:hypothetical protein